MLTLADVYESLLNLRPSWAEGTQLGTVVVDSRQVRVGSVFVALKGEMHDGHDFVDDALARGASVVIDQERDSTAAALAGKGSGSGPSVHVVKTSTGVAGLQLDPEPLIPTIFIVPSSLKALQDLAIFWRNRFSQCQTVAVTGSIGKSSTKELIASVLKRHFTVLKSKGNFNNEIGMPLTLMLLDASYQRLVVEMGMYALGEIRELCRIAQPTIGIVTNVGPSHLERLGTIERIAQAKGELVEALPAHGVAILNRDDPLVRDMQYRTQARKFYYGLDPESDVWADEIESFGLEGIAFNLHHGKEEFYVRVPLLGLHSVHTALAAASVGIVEGLFWDEVLGGLKDQAAQLRLIALPAESGTTILDDTYNASPESSLAALNLLADLNGRKVAVLGDMLELGSFEEKGHRIVGGRVAEVASVLVAVGERGHWIGEAAQEAGLHDTRFAASNQQAVEILREVMRAGDMILVKGSRGAKMEDIVSALARPDENDKAEDA